MSWLANLPHQIPFRAASAAHRIEDKRVEGVYVCTANDTLNAEIMLVEALAQFAGGLVFDAQGFFTGIEEVKLARVIEPGDIVTVAVTLDAEFGGTFRFSGTGHVDGVEVIRGKFYLANARP